MASAPSASLLARLQSAQKSGGLGGIVGHEEAAAWGDKDLSTASYDDLVGAFGASDLEDPQQAAAPPVVGPGPAVPGVPSPAPMPAPAPAPAPAPMQPGMGGPGMGMGSPSPMEALTGRAPQTQRAPRPGMAETPLIMPDPAMPGARQYPRQGQALQQMMRAGRGRIY